MTGSMLPLWERVSRVWCRAFHRPPMWPVNGHYRCPDCLRTYPVTWSNSPAPRAVAVTNRAPARVVAITRAVGKPA